MPVYMLQIASKYDKFSSSPVSYSNGNINYTHPAIFIPLKDKHMYAPLWDKNINANYNFMPNSTRQGNNVTITEFIANV